jgi:hypothetical protein
MALSAERKKEELAVKRHRAWSIELEVRGQKSEVGKHNSNIVFEI